MSNELETLRRAATRIRNEWKPNGWGRPTTPLRQFHRAVADWLDDLYERLTDTDYDEDDELAAALRGEVSLVDWPDVHHAVIIARTYLGE